MSTSAGSRAAARLAGVWYVGFLVLSILAGAVARAGGAQYGQPAPGQPVAALVLMVAAYPCLVVTGNTMYGLFRRVDRGVAGLMFVFVIVGVAVNFPDVRGYGPLPSAVWWWLWLVPLGLLILRSELIPKVVGWALLVGCLFHLSDFVTRLWLPYPLTVYRGVCYAVEFLAELSLVAWLLVKGVAEERSHL